MRTDCNDILIIQYLRNPLTLILFFMYSLCIHPENCDGLLFFAADSMITSVKGSPNIFLQQRLPSQNNRAKKKKSQKPKQNHGTGYLITATKITYVL